jgi:hypothetical protein
MYDFVFLILLIVDQDRHLHRILLQCIDNHFQENFHKTKSQQELK